jgi:hypothetical protein
VVVIDPDVSRMNNTFGFGRVVGSGLISSNSVSSATAGVPANNVTAKPILIHVILCFEIFMILASVF